MVLDALRISSRRAVRLPFLLICKDLRHARAEKIVRGFPRMWQSHLRFDRRLCRRLFSPSQKDYVSGLPSTCPIKSIHSSSLRYRPLSLSLSFPSKLILSSIIYRNNERGSRASYSADACIMKFRSENYDGYTVGS